MRDRHHALVSETTGLLISAVFGTVWFEAAASSSPTVLRGLERGFGISLFVGLVTATILVFKRSRPTFRSAGRSTGGDGTAKNREQPSAQGDRYPKRITWGVPALLGVESAAILMGAVVCNKILGHPEWVPAWISFVVGVHFFPMGWMLRVPRFHALAAAMCAVALGTAAFADVSHVGQAVWLALPGYGSALVLWAASMAGLWGLWRRVRLPG
ncbi:hypothetical protein ADL21_00805 [Streptomyces albus subsp. albus]|nr:hypothetical protein ADL21_00805 [Streptomyces albus subsp. albus]